MEKSFNIDPGTAKEEDPWDILAKLNKKRISATEKEAIEDMINRHVADMVDQGMIGIDAAWAYSIGHNPYLNTSDQPDNL